MLLAVNTCSLIEYDVPRQVAQSLHAPVFETAGLVVNVHFRWYKNGRFTSASFSNNQLIPSHPSPYTRRLCWSLEAFLISPAMYTAASILSLVALTSTVAGHGILVKPRPRGVGPVMDATCGVSVADLVRADVTSHVEDMPEAALLDPGFNAGACNLFLCRGLQFGDNLANVQNFTAGQVVKMQANISVPHEGPMNVSIVNTATNSVIGPPLISFDSYADEKLPQLPPSNTNFEVKIPSDLGDKCTVRGACVSCSSCRDAGI